MTTTSQQPKANGKLQEDLEKLWQFYQRAKAMPELRFIDALGSLLVQVENTHGRTTNIDARTQLAQVWIYKTALQSQVDEYTRITTTSLNRFFRLIELDDVRRKIVQNQENYPTLVTACLHASIEVKEDSHPKRRRELQVLLKDWLNQDYDNEVLSDTSELANVLYGAGPWDLLRPDFHSDLRLALHLAHTGYPVNGVYKILGITQKFDGLDVPNTLA